MTTRYDLGPLKTVLEGAEIARLVSVVEQGGYEAAAIGFMHSYANPDHERRMADALRAALPDLAISVSSVVSPQMRELPRFNTVIANAYVQPQMALHRSRPPDTPLHHTIWQGRRRF